MARAGMTRFQKAAQQEANQLPPTLRETATATAVRACTQVRMEKSEQTNKPTNKQFSSLQKCIATPSHKIQVSTTLI
jgi:hypothetical protein